jgi:hypothetical protein
MFTKLRIWWLKRRLRKLIYRFQDDYSFWQCGNELLDQVTGGRFSRDKALIQTMKDHLRAIDPNCPK